MVTSDQCHLNGPMCVAYGFCIAWLGIGCILTMAVISYEWHQKLRLLTRTPRAKWHILVRLTAIWTASFLITSPPLFGWDRYQMEVYSLPACSINWESTVWTDRLYVAVVFSLGLVLPLSVILHSYIRIFQIIRQVSNVCRLRKILDNLISRIRFECFYGWFSSLCVQTVTSACCSSTSSLSE
ncbi:hypothetical protein RvY_03838-2 [Ramazzottius varieornatus]|uniref:G-protein coupled receptors family 1 profile domain-containing protein n=1 Tax=Ramazzottius varieornatus TaxID=947166 RepID=A0A1D1UT31_RAMVA|nr:hypothetical protein RvY_03838-2 [Ramazzottius varieornatus]